MKIFSTVKKNHKTLNVYWIMNNTQKFKWYRREWKKKLKFISLKDIDADKFKMHIMIQRYKTYFFFRHGKIRNIFLFFLLYINIYIYTHAITIWSFEYPYLFLFCLSIYVCVCAMLCIQFHFEMCRILPLVIYYLNQQIIVSKRNILLEKALEKMYKRECIMCINGTYSNMHIYMYTIYGIPVNNILNLVVLIRFQSD